MQSKIVLCLNSIVSYCKVIFFKGLEWISRTTNTTGVLQKQSFKNRSGMYIFIQTMQSSPCVISVPSITILLSECEFWYSIPAFQDLCCIYRNKQWGGMCDQQVHPCLQWSINMNEPRHAWKPKKVLIKLAQCFNEGVWISKITEVISNLRNKHMSMLSQRRRAVTANTRFLKEAFLCDYLLPLKNRA